MCMWEVVCSSINSSIERQLTDDCKSAASHLSPSMPQGAAGRREDRSFDEATPSDSIVRAVSGWLQEIIGGKKQPLATLRHTQVTFTLLPVAARMSLVPHCTCPGNNTAYHYSTVFRIRSCSRYLNIILCLYVCALIVLLVIVINNSSRINTLIQLKLRIVTVTYFVH